MITSGAIVRSAAVALLLLISACATLPLRENATVSQALVDTADTRLGSAVVPKLVAHPGLSGIYPLPEGKGALASRLLLADAADRSLDVQYYIWHGDSAGILLMDAVRRAADRGVRVRLLVDDNGLASLDDYFEALDAHANIEVRIVNPFPNRSARWVGYLSDFGRLNHRMHNKSFTADGQVAIVGGRNIGNEYFAAGQEVSFADLDVLAVGPVVRDVSLAFDRYWNSEAAYPAALLLDLGTAAPEQIAVKAAEVRADPKAAAYIQALETTNVVRDLEQGGLPFEWARTQVVCDDPAKLLGASTGASSLLLDQLESVIGPPKQEFLLVSPYFVPTKAGTDWLVAMAKRGVQVTVLTNSLAATDVTAVHAGYAKRRKALLRGGVRLFELKPTAGADERTTGAGFSGRSGASLHAKTFSVDGVDVFVGSFNFDPRSAVINTEMGFVIDSPSLAARLERLLREEVPANAWEVRLTDAGSLEWIGHGPEGETHFTSDPQAGLMRRISVGIAGWLPVEGLL
jgi:putative cardiolipin synthase